MENPNPIVFQVNDRLERRVYSERDFDDTVDDPFTPQEVYQMVRSINDPEHPLTLEQLNVVRVEDIQVHGDRIDLAFTPTIPHCSMATLIGLCIRVQLQRCIPGRFRVAVRVRPGAHQSEADINRQLADKERVCAAIENDKLISVVNQCIAGPPRVGIAL